MKIHETREQRAIATGALRARLFVLREPGPRWDEVPMQKRLWRRQSQSRRDTREAIFGSTIRQPDRARLSTAEGVHGW